MQIKDNHHLIYNPQEKTSIKLLNNPSPKIYFSHHRHMEKYKTQKLTPTVGTLNPDKNLRVLAIIATITILVINHLKQVANKMPLKFHSQSIPINSSAWLTYLQNLKSHSSLKINRIRKWIPQSHLLNTNNNNNTTNIQIYNNHSYVSNNSNNTNNNNSNLLSLLDHSKHCQSSWVNFEHKIFNSKSASSQHRI